MTSTITIPVTYPSLNKVLRLPWWERRKIKNDFQFVFAAAIRRTKPRPYFEGPVRITIELTFTSNRRRDPDNYSPKWLLDSLVQAKVIQDDSTEFMTESPKVTIKQGKVEGTVVRIED